MGLLVFVPSEGGSTLIFNIGQTISERPVMEAIKRFLLSLPGNYTNRANYDGVALSTHLPPKNSSQNQQPSILIEITETEFIKNKLVPFFDSLTFLSKKGLDYQD